MQASHKVSALFDDPNLIGSAGLVPVMRLAHRAGLQDLLEQRLSVPSANAAAKAACVCFAAVDTDDDRPGGVQPAITQPGQQIGDHAGVLARTLGQPERML